jgi:hypothetical protein
VSYVIRVFLEGAEPIDLSFNTLVKAREEYRRIQWLDRGEGDFELEVVDDTDQFLFLNRDKLICVLMYAS